MLLRGWPLKKKDEWNQAEDDAAERAELIHVGKKHRLALHGVVEVRHGEVAMVRNIAWSSDEPPNELLHQNIGCSDVLAEHLLMDLCLPLEHRADKRNTYAAAFVAH